MGVITKQKICKSCGQPRPFDKNGLNNTLHLVLTIFTGGVWLAMWLLLYLYNSFKSGRCRVCGVKG